MMHPSLTNLLRHQSVSDNLGVTPVFFRLMNPEDCRVLEKLLLENPHIAVCDKIDSQLRDLVKLEHPSEALSEEQYSKLVNEKLSNKHSNEYGVWVYYPWRAMVVHMLDEEEFIRVRTIRNAYKITFEEQAELRKKKIGIIGLSVGQSVSLALAMERIGGELRIADFDVLELSNLNRIRTGLANLGLRKTTIVAREIAEIDPFIRVKCYHLGINLDNVDSFFDEDGVLDLLVEECDSVDVKILARQHARRRSIAVVMDTSDQMMIDVERFDIEPGRKVLHGLLGSELSTDNLSLLERRNLTLRLLEVEKISERGQFSMREINKSITSWPQLASDVSAGGATTAMFVRNILLGNEVASGRSRFDLLKLHNSNANHK